MAVIKRTASAQWNGSLKEGKGTISTQSGVLDHTRYGFTTRFGEEKGTNPEELIGAAHAGCFSMALSNKLGEKGLTAEKIETSATVVLEKLETGFAVTTVDLTVKAKVPGAKPDVFEAVAQDAKANCPISKLLKATINLKATLE
jgi:osmotically inducible protein OsmC